MPRSIPAGSTIQKSLHKHALIGFSTHAYSFKRLALLRSPHPPPRLTSYAPRTRGHFTPQHWLLCHLGLGLYISSSSRENTTYKLKIKVYNKFIWLSPKLKTRGWPRGCYKASCVSAVSDEARFLCLLRAWSHAGISAGQARALSQGAQVRARTIKTHFGIRPCICISIAMIAP